MIDQEYISNGERNIRLLCQEEEIKEDAEKQSGHAQYTTVL